MTLPDHILQKVRAPRASAAAATVQDVSLVGSETAVQAETPDGTFGNLRINDAGELLISTLDIFLVLERIADTMERVQQQLAKINEGENLEPGERYYGS